MILLADGEDSGSSDTLPLKRFALGYRTAPCEILVEPKPQWQQTHAVQGGVETEAALKAYAQGKAVNGAGAWGHPHAPR